MHVHPIFPFYVIFAVFVIFIYDRPHVSVISLSVYYYFNPYMPETIYHPSLKWTQNIIFHCIIYVTVGIFGLTGGRRLEKNFLSGGGVMKWGWTKKPEKGLKIAIFGTVSCKKVEGSNKVKITVFLVRRLSDSVRRTLKFGSVSLCLSLSPPPLSRKTAR